MVQFLCGILKTALPLRTLNCILLSMMFFAFFLILLGIGFILFGNYSHKDEKDKGKKGNIPRYLVKKLFNRAARKKEEYSGEIKKRIFNKKYPERELDADLESILIQERSVDRRPIQEHPEIKHNLEREPDLKELEFPVQNTPPQIKIEEIPNRTKPLDKTNLVLSGILYLDYGKEIPMDSKIINDMDWEENLFQHFRRIGKAELLEREGSIEYKNKESLFLFPIQEIDKIVFYDTAITIFPNSKDLPNFLFFTKDTFLFKQKITEELRQF
jgi:hypothetical protein